MSDVETLFVSWPVGIALSCWLFFEITKHGPCVEQSVVRRRVRREINFAETWSFVRCSTFLIPSSSGRSASR